TAMGSDSRATEDVPPAELLAQLRAKLAQYDELTRASERLVQEEKTLENYVRNMMDSNVFS
ncbi:hypothetical protein IWQ56_006214, partial [Coemansia nantahalensis]